MNKQVEIVEFGRWLLKSFKDYRIGINTDIVSIGDSCLVYLESGLSVKQTLLKLKKQELDEALQKYNDMKINSLDRGK